MDFYIDAHNHLADGVFCEDIDQVIESSLQNRVKACVVVPECFAEFERVFSIAESYPTFIAPCLGIHPVQKDSNGEERSVMDKDTTEAFPFIEEHSEEIVGIGEIGLDFTPRFCKGENDKETQRKVFIKQIKLAKRYSLPVNVHSRSAGRPTIALLKEQGATQVLLHAFDGRPSVAMEGVSCGYYFSIPPSIVRSEQQKLVKQLPLDHMLLETDSPALGPEKQVRNEPKNIEIACEYIAKIKKCDLETVRQITTENTLKLFPKITNMICVNENI